MVSVGQALSLSAARGIGAGAYSSVGLSSSQSSAEGWGYLPPSESSHLVDVLIEGKVTFYPDFQQVPGLTINVTSDHDLGDYSFSELYPGRYAFFWEPLNQGRYSVKFSTTYRVVTLVVYVIQEPQGYTSTRYSRKTPSLPLQVNRSPW